MTNLTIRRDRGWADKLRSYKILVDGVEIGRLAERGELVHDIHEGRHVVEAKVDWCGSGPLSVDVGPEGVVLYVKSALRGWKVFFAIVYVIFIPRGYLTLQLE